MLAATLIGFAVGAALAGLFWAIVATGLDHLNQGLLGSGGLVALIGLSLWLDGYVIAALLGFVGTTVAILVARAALRRARLNADRASSRS